MASLPETSSHLQVLPQAPPRVPMRAGTRHRAATRLARPWQRRAAIVLALASGLLSTTLGAQQLGCHSTTSEGAKHDTNVRQSAGVCRVANRPTPELSVTNRPHAEKVASDQTRGGSAEAIDDDSPMIEPHLPSFLVYSHFDPNQAPFESLAGETDTVEDQEAVFQVSFKVPVGKRLFGTNLDAYFAYTSRSWWQVSNDAFSSPFRETNYMPEVFVRSDRSGLGSGVALEHWSLGLVHESNGREQALSRSWNRVLARYGVRINDRLSVQGQVWYRIPDDEEDDDNPNEYRFFGYGDFRAVWAANENVVTALVRPGTRDTSFELTWSRPINRVFRVYATYFNGFGESLLDYDFRTERVSIGIALNDFGSF